MNIIDRRSMFYIEIWAWMWLKYWGWNHDHVCLWDSYNVDFNELIWYIRNCDLWTLMNFIIILIISVIYININTFDFNSFLYKTFLSRIISILIYIWLERIIWFPWKDFIDNSEIVYDLWIWDCHEMIDN